MTKTICLLIAAALLAASAAASTDPFLGRWTLNLRRSKYPAGACPKRMVIEMNSVERGIHYRSETTYANGNTLRAEYTADYDGKPAIVLGSRGMLLPVSLKRIDSHTVIASYTKSSEVVATSRRVVSGDGRLMTITTTSKDQSGKKATAVGVYEKDTGSQLDLRPARSGNGK